LRSRPDLRPARIEIVGHDESKPKYPKAKLVLDSAGIREHACDILDGGVKAFQKRKDKYRI